MRRMLLMLALLVSACTQPSTIYLTDGAEQPERFDPATAPETAMFREVRSKVVPAAEQMCRRHARGVRCTFVMVVDLDPKDPSNAFMFEAEDGTPVLRFNIGILQEVRNADELAFVISHEASHHILGHTSKTEEVAALGAEYFGTLEAERGGSENAIEEAQELGEFVGSRIFSKSFELEADAMGSVITANAGYNPLRGAEFFARLPDPGDRFLGTHPPNTERQDVVQAVSEELGFIQ